MVEDTVERLIEYVHERAGDGLRTVVVMNEDGWEVSYLREDLQQMYSGDTYAAVVDTFRLEDPCMSPDLENKPIGERRALLHYHENACVIQLPYSESETILISVSRDIGRDLVRFLESCREIVQRQA